MKTAATTTTTIGLGLLVAELAVILCSTVSATTGCDPQCVSQCVVYGPSTCDELCSTDYQLTADHTCTDIPIVFSFGRASQYSSVGTMLPLDVQRVNPGNPLPRYNTSTSFIASRPGIHFVQMCVGISPSTPAQVKTNGGNLTVGIDWESTDQNGVDGACRTVLVVLGRGSRLSLILSAGAVYSDREQQLVTLDIFSVDDVLSQWAALSALSAILTVPGWSMYTMKFDQIHILPVVANTYNVADSVYNCTQTGPYFFSITVGVTANIGATVSLQGLDIMPTLLRTGQHNDTITAGRNLLINCVAGSTVNVVLSEGRLTQGTNTDFKLVSFLAFPYSPQTVTATSWAVFRSTSVDATLQAVDGVLFDVVNINQGSLYNPSTGVVTISSAGYYYIYFTAGLPVNTATKVKLTKTTTNGQLTTLFTIYRTSTISGRVEISGRGGIVHLSAGDQLSVSLPRGYSIYSYSTSLDTSFFGFQLYNTQEQTQFLFNVDAVKITDVTPSQGLEVGGTRLSITGSGLNFTQANFGLLPENGQRADIINTDAVNSETSYYKRVVVTQPSNRTQLRYQLVILPVDGTIHNTTFHFTYLPNPVITDVKPQSHLSGGGTMVTLIGEHLNSTTTLPNINIITVLRPRNSSEALQPPTVTTRPCVEGTSTTVLCHMPSITLPQQIPDNTTLILTQPDSMDLEQSLQQNTNYSVNIYVGIEFADYHRYDNLSSALPNSSFKFYQSPVFQLSPNIIFNPKTDTTIRIKGKNMNRGCQLVDYRVTIGNMKCDVDFLTSNELTCRPPTVQPTRLSNDTFCQSKQSVLVFVGNTGPYLSACIQYKKEDLDIALIVGLTVGVGGACLLVVIIVVVVVVCLQRRRRCSQTDKVKHAPTPPPKPKRSEDNGGSGVEQNDVSSVHNETTHNETDWNNCSNYDDAPSYRMSHSEQNQRDYNIVNNIYYDDAF